MENPHKQVSVFRTILSHYSSRLGRGFLETLRSITFRPSIQSRTGDWIEKELKPFCDEYFISFSRMKRGNNGDEYVSILFLPPWDKPETIRIADIVIEKHTVALFFDEGVGSITAEPFDKVFIEKALAEIRTNIRLYQKYHKPH